MCAGRLPFLRAHRVCAGLIPYTVPVEASSLSTLLLRARRALALNFPVAVWVRAELSQVNERRGHRYLVFVEKGPDDQPLAKAQGNVWSRTYRNVIRQRGTDAADVLQAGQEVCVQVEIEFHELYGFKLNVVDWDPSFTLGQLELKRRQIITQLDEEGLLHANSSLSLKPVLQRVAVLTSSAAAGYADFAAQLRENPYGYHFAVTLHDVSVQGANVSASVTAALADCARNAQRYDAVLILRGGGSRLDLAGFDDLGIGRAIAASPLPVLVGIGHEIDETLPDLVANTSLKTPTALAEFLIERAAQYESEQLSLGRSVARLAQDYVATERRRLTELRAGSAYAAKHQLSRQGDRLERGREYVEQAAQLLLRDRRHALQQFALELEGLDPTELQRRGFVYVAVGGRRIVSARDLTTGDRLSTYFADGTIDSTVL